MTNTSLRVALAQLNCHVGDLEKNIAQHIAAATRARDEQKADLIIFPESSLTGYPAEDLLLRPHFLERTAEALTQLETQIHGIVCVVGHPHVQNGKLYNAATVFYNGERLGTYCKRKLPNYSVFDERRYFTAGREPFIFKVKDIPVGLIICEDAWTNEVVAETAALGAKLLITLNASPFETDKHEQRSTVLRKRAIHNHLPIAYVNCVGGQDELVFDGGSMIIDAEGNIACLAPFFQESIITKEMIFNEQTHLELDIINTPNKLSRIYDAITLGIRDYIHKNRFPGVLIGVSGGIDSALTLALAVDALGADNVHAVILPSRYSSQLSLEEATQITQNLGVSHQLIDIEPTVQALTASLPASLKSITLQNLQARARGIILMALSNDTGNLVLTTGNRSEVAVGYCTLYGDMVGGFAPLKDVPKTLVYELATYRNQRGVVIPERTITRAPTAELAPNQTDQDTLPPYDRLDAILSAYLNQGLDADAIIHLGMPEEEVRLVLQLVKNNEYKRKQAAIGPRINSHSFGKDWRMPVTNGFKST